MTKNITEEKQKKLNKQLFDAIGKYEMSADINFLKCLLEAGADPNTKNKDGCAALHATVTYNGINKTKLLLKYNADMYIKDDKGKTPFDISLLYGRYNIVELFISHGYVPSEEDMQKIQNHRLFEAITNNDFHGVKDAVEAGADVNTKDGWNTSVLKNSMQKNMAMTEYLLKSGADPNTQDYRGDTALHEAAWSGWLNKVKLLLEYGADMTIKNNQGRTPYVIGVARKNNDITEFFLSQGYIPSKKDLQAVKNNRLEYAVKNDNLPSISSAIKDGADVNFKDEFGDSMLFITIRINIKCVKCLLEAGADPNIPDGTGNTALHKAVSYGHMNKVKLLLKYKADIYIKNKSKQTPFDISINKNRYDIAELFISHGYVPSEKDMQKIKDHRLFKAVKESDLSAVKAAVEDGADINAKDSDGEPLLLKTDSINIKILRYLLENGANPNMSDDYGWSLLYKLISEGNIDAVKILLEFGVDVTVRDKWGETPFAKALHRESCNIAELFILNGYVPSESEFNLIKDEVTRESLMTLTAHVQEHKAKLTEETETASHEFAYADEIMEI